MHHVKIFGDHNSQLTVTSCHRQCGGVDRDKDCLDEKLLATNVTIREAVEDLFHLRKLQLWSFLGGLSFWE